MLKLRWRVVRFVRIFSVETLSWRTHPLDRRKGAQSWLIWRLARAFFWAGFSEVMK